MITVIEQQQIDVYAALTHLQKAITADQLWHRSHWLNMSQINLEFNKEANDFVTSLSFSTWVEPGFTVRSKLFPQKEIPPQFNMAFFNNSQLPLGDELRACVIKNYVECLNGMMNWLNSNASHKNIHYPCPTDSDINVFIQKLRARDMVPEPLMDILVEVALHPHADQQCPQFRHLWNVYAGLNEYDAKESTLWKLGFEQWLMQEQSPSYYSLTLLNIQDT